MSLAGVDPDLPTGKRMYALAAVLSSSVALMEFTDLLQLDAETAARYMVWAVDVLLQQTVREQAAACAPGAVLLAPGGED